MTPQTTTPAHEVQEVQAAQGTQEAQNNQTASSEKEHPDYISPLTDTAFIRLFATNERKYNTLHLLQAIFENDPYITINDVTINDPRRPGERRKTRGCVYDLHCSENGRSYIIELQMYNEFDVFMDRAVFNMSKQISTDQAAGTHHQKLKGTIFIGITNFDLNELAERDVVRLALGDMDRPKTFYMTDRFRLFFFQLNNFNKKIEECTTKLDYWLYSLKNLPNMNKDDEFSKLLYNKVQELKPFFDDAVYENLTKEEQDEYLLDCTNRECERKNRLACELRGEERGIKIGEERGLKIGEERGLKIGEEKGKVIGEKIGEEKNQMTTAAKMKAKGYPIEEIVDITGLSKATVEEIQ